MTQNSQYDRQNHINYWAKEKREVSLISSIAMFVGILFCFAVVSPSPTGVPDDGSGKIGGTIAAFCAFIVSKIFFDQRNEANDQIIKWEKYPTRIVADQRREAFENGFFHAMRLNMRGEHGQVYHSRSLLSPQELEYLYRESFLVKKNEIEKVRNLSITDKGQYVLRFSDENPLSSQAWKYVFGNVPSKVFSVEYEDIEAKIKGIADQFDNRCQEINSEHSRLKTDSYSQESKLKEAYINKCYHASLLFDEIDTLFTKAYAQFIEDKDIVMLPKNDSCGKSA